MHVWQITYYFSKHAYIVRHKYIYWQSNTTIMKLNEVKFYHYAWVILLFANTNMEKKMVLTVIHLTKTSYHNNAVLLWVKVLDREDYNVQQLICFAFRIKKSTSLFVIFFVLLHGYQFAIQIKIYDFSIF